MILDKALSLPRNIKRLLLVGFDLILLPFALWCSFSLRLGEFFVPQGQREGVVYLFIIGPVLCIPIFIRFGLYHAIVRYMGYVAMLTIVKAVSLYTLVLGLLILLSGYSGVPRSVILINWLMVVLLIGCSRALARWWLRGSFNLPSRRAAKKRVAIYGAGSAGVQIQAALANGDQFQPVAFIDDNPALQDNFIEGLRVHPFSSLSRLIESQKITEVMIAMPSVP